MSASPVPAPSVQHGCASRPNHPDDRERPLPACPHGAMPLPDMPIIRKGGGRLICVVPSRTAKLDLPVQSTNNTFMYASWSLTLLSSVLLVLPPCWCCALGCEPPQPKHRCDSCCSKQEKPVPAPTKPSKPACCERVPLDRPGVPHQVAAPAVCDVCPDATIVQAAFSEKPADLCVLPSLPLRVLHCVRLC
jgi:hypothetical protein